MSKFLRPAGLLVVVCSLLVLYNCQKGEPGPAPVLNSFAPLSGVPYSVVTLSGENFSQTPSDNQIQINGLPAEVLSGSQKELRIRVPVGAATGRITITSNSQTATSAYDFTVTTTPLPTQHSFIINDHNRVASIILTQAEFDGWNDPSRSDGFDYVFKDVYTQFNDDFDFVMLIYNNRVQANDISGSNQFVSNNVSGIGGDIYDYSYVYYSSGKLKSIILIPKIQGGGPFLHEIMHQWANRMLPSETFDPINKTSVTTGLHWGYTGCGGALGGFQQSTLETNVDGNPHRYRAHYGNDSFFSFNNNVGPYSSLELYMMGLIPPDEVTPFDMFTQITSSDYLSGVFEANARTTYDIAKIEHDFGPRIPDYTTSQKDFKILTLVLTPTPLTAEEWGMIDPEIEQLTRPTMDADTVHFSFFEATFGKATLTADQLSESVKQ